MDNDAGTKVRSGIWQTKFLPRGFAERYDSVMKIDANRVLEQVRELRDSRDTKEETLSTSEWVEAELVRAGFEVECLDLTESRFPDLIAGRLGWLIAGVLLMVISLLNFYAEPKGPVRSILDSLFKLVAMVWMIVVLSDRIRFGKRLPPRVVRQDVFAHRGAENNANARVVFLAHLNAPDRRWPLVTRGWLFVLLLCVPAGLATFLPRLGYRGQVLLGGSIVVELVGTLLLMREPFRGRPAFDHRPGLALLVELARSWPTRPDGKLEAWFIAAGANTYNLWNKRGGLTSASSQELVRRIQQDEAGKPTLVIRFFDPGLGRGLVLLGPHKSAWMAHTAAKDHWIPHRFSAVSRRFAPEHFAPCEGVEAVSILADRRAPSREAVPPSSVGSLDAPDPALVSATAQLATELALRWARQATAQPESLARSSQKLG